MVLTRVRDITGTGEDHAVFGPMPGNRINTLAQSCVQRTGKCLDDEDETARWQGREGIAERQEALDEGHGRGTCETSHIYPLPTRLPSRLRRRVRSGTMRNELRRDERRWVFVSGG
jgi:hypothetical protein